MSRTDATTKGTGTGGGITGITGGVVASGVGTVSAYVPDLNVVKKIGNLVVVGHSFTAGTTQVDAGVPNMYQQGMVPKVMGMLGVHEQNMVHIGIAGSAISQPYNSNNVSYGGWAGALALLYPNNSASMNAASDIVESDGTIPAVGAGIIVHGVNDYSMMFDNTSIGIIDNQRLNLNIAAGKQAYRTILSRMRAGVVYTAQTVNGTPTWEASTLSFSASWNASTLGTTLNSGSAIRSASVSGETVTVTIPQNFTGGTVAVNFIGQENFGTYLTSTMATTSSNISLFNGKRVFGSGGYVPHTGSVGAYFLQVDNEVMVVASTLQSSVGGNMVARVQRSVAGTTAATHEGVSFPVAAAYIPSTFSYIQWSGTAVGTVANTSSTITSGNGRTYIGGQGTNGYPVSVTERFYLDATSGGKTIVGTFNKNALETGMTADFDSWWIEAQEPPPIVVVDALDFPNDPYYFAPSSASFGIPGSARRIAVWNSMVSSVVSEFTDGQVQIADAYSAWNARSGLLGSDMVYGSGGAGVTTTATTLTDTGKSGLGAWLTNGSNGAVIFSNGKFGHVTATTSSQLTVSSWSGGGSPGNGASYYAVRVPFVANDTTFTPPIGGAMTPAGLYGAEIQIVTSVTGTAPNWDVTVSRAGRQTSIANYQKSAFTNTLWYGMADRMHTDMVHPNAHGHSIIAEEIYQAYQAMPVPSVYQLSEVAGNWSQYSQSFSMGVIDGAWLTPNASGSAGSVAATQNRQYAVPIYVPKQSIITDMAVVMGSTGMGANGVVRFGIYLPDSTHSRPSRLLQDFGTQAATGARAAVIKTNCYQVLRPGWYWLTATQQVGTAGIWDVTAALNFPVLNSLSQPSTVGLTNAGTPVGYYRDSISGALSDWGTTQYNEMIPNQSAAQNTMPRIFVKLRSPQFA